MIRAIILALTILGLQGCAYVTIEGPEYKARLITFTPTGTATGFEAVLTNKGRVSLNREQGGAEGLVSEVGSIVSPNPLD